MPLRLCASCARHVRASDVSCPFCGARARAGVPEPRSRATRAALVFGGATLVVAGVACGGAMDPSADAGPGDASPDVSPVPAYGLPPPDAGRDVNIQPPDGAPPPMDAGGDATAQPAYGAPPPDAGRDVNVQPPYGSPPPPDAGRD